MPMMMAALSAYHAGISQIVMAGDPLAAETSALVDVVRRRYLPFTVLVPLEPAHAEALARLLPWTAAMSGAAARAFVCRDFTCLTPASSADEFASQLEKGAL